MPLNRPALPLGPGPRSVAQARRWVSEVCEEIGRDELVECAQLGVSELVTNALLHATAPIELRVGGTDGHPRFEVRDASVEPPVLPAPSAPDVDAPAVDLDDDLDHLDDLLLTFGRGLTLVARSATAWGVDLEPDGKVVWFVPAASFTDNAGVAGVITGGARSTAGRVPLVDPVDVRVVGVPIRAWSTFNRHLRELRREVRLLALAQESAYPLARDLSDLFGSLERHLRDVIGTVQLERALAEGRVELDFEVSMARAATQTLARLIEMLDLADEFCREERLLSLARSPEQRRFQHWVLGEFVRQGDGGQPVPWTPVDVGRRSVVS